MFSYVLAVLVGNVGKDGFGQLHSKCHSCVQRQIPMFLMTSERDHCTWLSLVDLVDRNLDNFGMSFFCHACATCSEKREQGTSMHRCIHMHPTFFFFFLHGRSYLRPFFERILQQILHLGPLVSSNMLSIDH